MSEPIRVCCAGDGLLSTGEALERESDAFEVTYCSSPAAALPRLDRHVVDCLLTELEPAEREERNEPHGTEFIRAVRDRDLTLPVVALTDDGSGASEAIAAGATDFYARSSGDERPALLASRIELAVERAAPAGTTADRGPVAECDGSADGNAPEDVHPISDRDDYRRFVERVADPMYVLDATGSCVAVNDALLEYTGYDREQIEGRGVGEFIDESAYETATTAIERLYEQHTGSRDAFEVTIRGADGESRIAEAHVTVITTDTDEYAGSVGVLQDITERKERIRELGQYEAIVETAPVGLFVVDEDGYLRWHNEVFTTDLGIEREIVGTHFAELADEGFIPETVLENHRERVRQLLSSENDDDQITYEEEWVDTNGERGVTEFSMGLLPLEDGEFAGTVHAFRNVTERVQYREELERQNDRLEKFASLVSHDLRNPLNVAQGHLDLLETKCDDESIDETRWAINRMEELIDDLLALARYGRTVADRERVELADLVAVAWAGVDTADATMVADFNGTITAHEGRVRELLENLFRNAIDHGGEDVTVTVGQLDSDTDTAGFFVEDNGSGLPDTGDIFEFGHTTADEGTGLGLGIVSEIADAHGWQVSACDGRDGGARFEIRGVNTVQETQPTE